MMTNVAWKKESGVYYLVTPSEQLVTLHYELIRKSVFWMNHEIYEVRRSGFWNQRYAIYKNDVEIVSLTHNFWGSIGKIVFSDGTQYASDYQYKNILTLYFLDGKSEILSYQVGAKNGEQEAVFKIGIALVDAEKLLILATLGMVMFLNIFSEFGEGEDGAEALMLVAAS